MARVVALAQVHANWFYEIKALLKLAQVESAAGLLDEAAADVAIAEERNPGSAGGLDIEFLITRADLSLRRGDHVEGLRLAEEAAAIVVPAEMVSVRCSVLRLLGEALLARGNPEAALSTFQQLVTAASKAPYPCRVAEGREGAAAAATALGLAQDATDHLGAAATLRRTTGSQRIPRPVIEQHLLVLKRERPQAQYRP